VKDPAIIEEIEWQFALGQSRHAAMTAVGYSNELTLARWLYRHNAPTRQHLRTEDQRMMTPNQECRCPRVKHHHGTRNNYLTHACRCTPCTDDATAKRDRARRLQAYGRPHPHKVDAQPARNHANKLIKGGMTISAIARAANLSHPAIARLIGSGKQAPIQTNHQHHLRGHPHNRPPNTSNTRPRTRTRNHPTHPSTHRNRLHPPTTRTPRPHQPRQTTPPPHTNPHRRRNGQSHRRTVHPPATHTRPSVPTSNPSPQHSPPQRMATTTRLGRHRRPTTPRLPTGDRSMKTKNCTHRHIPRLHPRSQLRHQLLRHGACRVRTPSNCRNLLCRHHFHHPRQPARRRGEALDTRRNRDWGCPVVPCVRPSYCHGISGRVWNRGTCGPRRLHPSAQTRLHPGCDHLKHCRFVR